MNWQLINGLLVAAENCFEKNNVLVYHFKNLNLSFTFASNLFIFGVKTNNSTTICNFCLLFSIVIFRVIMAKKLKF